MNTILSRSAALAAILAFGAAASPAIAAGPPPSTPAQSEGATNAAVNRATTNQAGEDEPGTPRPNASAKSKRRAYGRYCANQSRKHVDGEKGTPFSRCVTAMAKLANDNTPSPRKACKTESRKHADGEKGTPFSRCVSAGAKLLEDLRQKDETPGS